MTRFLAGEDESILLTRPSPDVWSALAYACHVRDVLSVFDARIARMLTEDAPELGWWDHEAAVEADAYEKQVPTEVAAALAANAAALSATLSAVPEEGWDRTGTRRDGEVSPSSAPPASPSTKAPTTSSTSAGCCAPPGVADQQR